MLRISRSVKLLGYVLLNNNIILILQTNRAKDFGFGQRIIKTNGNQYFLKNMVCLAVAHRQQEAIDIINYIDKFITINLKEDALISIRNFRLGISSYDNYVSFYPSLNGVEWIAKERDPLQWPRGWVPVIYFKSSFQECVKL